jgi:hypothetical protein
MMNNDELGEALAKYALAAGQSPEVVQRVFQVDGDGMTVGQRAQERLDAFMADPAWMAKVERGDIEARGQFNALSVAMAWQQGQDRDAQYAASLEGIKQADAERLAAEAARAQAAADSNTDQQ